MNRHELVHAIVLKTNRIGEIHRGVTLFSRERGIIQAIAHGANSPRGSLKHATVPLTMGAFRLYHNPVAGSTKISEVELPEWLEQLNGNIDCWARANVWSELLMKSPGEQPQDGFDLLLASLRQLDHAAGVANPAGDVMSAPARLGCRFLWRFFLVEGVCPDVRECGRCGCILKEAVYQDRFRQFVCPACGGRARPELNPAALAWLAAETEAWQARREGDSREAQVANADFSDFAALELVLLRFAQDLVEGPLKSLSLLRSPGVGVQAP